MRIMLIVKLPHAQFNAAMKDGTVGAKMAKVMEATKPEAAYFTEFGGNRGAVLIVDLADPSKIPALVEPWFLTFNAEVESKIMMTPDDLKKAGLDKIGKQWA